MQPISTCVRTKQTLPRCEKLTKAACYDHFDQMDCGAVFDFCASELMIPYLTAGYNYYDISKQCDTDTACYPQRENVSSYLNDPAIRQALGADDAAGKFLEQNMDVYSSFWASGDPLHPAQYYIAELLNRGVKMLIYAGSYDFVANWVGNMRWTLDMEWPGQEAFGKTELTEWFVDGEPAGKTRAYGNFTFATIYGAGHLAPHDKPVQSLVMINRWLADKAL